MTSHSSRAPDCRCRTSATYVGTVSSTVPAPHHKHFQIYTHNRLLTTYRGDIGVKNGYTVAANATYVGAATRNGHTILITLMHAQPYFWDEARSLLDWGFRARGKVDPVGTLVDPQQPTAHVEAASAEQAPEQTTVVLSARQQRWHPALAARAPRRIRGDRRRRHSPSDAPSPADVTTAALTDLRYGNATCALGTCIVPR